MSDMKSKLPDLKELASMTSKLYNDIKISVTQIIQDYKEVRAKATAEEEQKVSEEVIKTEVEIKAAPKAAKKEAPVEAAKEEAPVEIVQKTIKEEVTVIETAQEASPGEDTKTDEIK